MSKEFKYISSLEEAHEYGIDPDHIIDHIVATVLCAIDNDIESLDDGFYVKFVDLDEREWSLTVIPPDGGSVIPALMQKILEEEL